MIKLTEVTNDEKDTIQELFERLNSLNSMTGTLADSVLSIDQENWLYKKLMDDSVKTRIAYNNWWQDICEKYNLDSNLQNLYSVDFQKLCIYQNEDKCTGC
jgi:CXXX repeat modification system protein